VRKKILRGAVCLLSPLLPTAPAAASNPLPPTITDDATTAVDPPAPTCITECDNGT